MPGDEGLRPHGPAQAGKGEHQHRPDLRPQVRRPEGLQARRGEGGGPAALHEPGEKWRIPYGDAKDSVLILVFGTSNVKVERKTSLDRHIEWAAEQLRKRLRQRVRQALRTKAMTERVEKRKSKEERAEMMRALHKDLLELIRRYPRIRKQDVTDAFDRARNMDTVCRVMED